MKKPKMKRDPNSDRRMLGPHGLVIEHGLPPYDYTLYCGDTYIAKGES